MCVSERELRRQKSLEVARHQLVALVRKKKARFVEWTARQPTEWRPYEVLNPDTGLQFTSSSAWALIGDLLERGHPMQEIVLRKPPGKRAYVLIVELDPAYAPLYIKLQLGNGKVICRSFHYSEKTQHFDSPGGKANEE